MSIKCRLDDSTLLFNAGRRDGALLNLLVAIAATARRRRPRSAFTDRVAFEGFLCDEAAVVTPSIDRLMIYVPNADVTKYPDRMMPIEAIVYLMMRCGLVHEGVLPDSIRFVDGIDVVVDEDAVHFGHILMERLAMTVVLAPENSDLFEEYRHVSDDDLAKLLFGEAANSDINIRYIENRRRRMAELWGQA
jgi:hypothetical protein